MIFEWNADTVRWYKTAAAYTGYYRKLAALLAPLLRADERFCDMGCGLGLIDLELAGTLRDITCVDLSPAAIGALEAEAQVRGIGHIHTHLADADTFPGMWDTIYLSFFSSRHLERFIPRAKRLLVVLGGSGKHSFFPERYRKKQRNTVPQEEAYLREAGLPYRLTEAALEFGQPFESRNEARAFVHSYAPDITSGDLEAFLDARLEATADERWPLYMPRQRQIGIFEVGPF